MGQHYRWTQRTDPSDRTDSIQVERDPEKLLPYDPDRVKDPVELNDEQVSVLSRYAVPEKATAEDDPVEAAPATTDTSVKSFSREEFEAMDADEIKKLAGDRNVPGRSGKNKEELIALLLEQQEGGR